MAEEKAHPPNTLSLTALKKAAAGCRACPLYKTGTQTVFGEGNANARLMIVGEQPGDAEDREGRPFVGSSGNLLDRLLKTVGIERGEIYITNAIKHFKWATTRGRRRIHAKPSMGEMKACRPWLESEVRAVDPWVIVALGSTAGRAVLDRTAKIGQERGAVLTGMAGVPVILSWHPAAVLRVVQSIDRRQKENELAEDLRLAKEVIESWQVRSA